jgi:ATP-dependent DNA ligase
LDGEAAVCGQDGVAVFYALHRRGAVAEAVLQAFDLLGLNSKDQRPLPLSERRAKLDRLLDGSPAGIVFNEHIDEDGAVVFRHACSMGLEGIVLTCLVSSDHDWLKMKNPEGPAMMRHREAAGNAPASRLWVESNPERSAR